MPLSLVPKPAAFVLVRIDPVATVEALNDPIATATARQLPTKKYVAYVSKAINAFDWKERHHTYAIQLTSPTVPAPCDADCIAVDMYTPVLPAAAHPLGRAPLAPTTPLPWPCYQPSFMRSIVRVPVRLEDDASAVLLEPAEATRHRRILADEDARRGISLRASTSSATPDGYVNFSDLDYFACPIPVDRASEEQFYADSFEASSSPSTSVVVDVSYDLSKVDELPDPLEFFEEKRRLKQLETESNARKAQLTEISTPPEPEYCTEEVPHVDATLTEETRPAALWSVWQYPKFPELLSSVRIPTSVVREVTTQAKRLSAYLGHIGEEGLHLLQSWTLAVRFV